MRPVWLVLLPVAFLVYVLSFSGYRILEERYDVLGDGDSAAFAHLITDFSFTRTYGDPYAVRGRSVADVAQKHKVHHLPYVAVAAGIHAVARGIYHVLGAPARLALYSVNALIVCLNLVLLRMLLVRYSRPGQPVWPFLAFHAFALSTWVFASVPESWPFSATLVLAFFLLLRSGRLGPLALAAVVGVFMLNNVMLGALINLIVLERVYREGRIGWRTLGLVPAFSAIAIATWAVLMTLLSPLEPMLRPDHFVHYTLWFQEFTARTLPPWDPFVWKAALSNLLVTSVVSNQPDPALPLDAVRLTLRGSALGAAATAAWLAVGLRVVYSAVSEARARLEAGEKAGVLLAGPDFWPVAFCVMMALITGLLYFSSGFLYSTIVVPIMAVVLCRFLDLRRRVDLLLCGALLVLMIVNNALQVAAFGRRLAELSAGL